jgi:hypothetical protein
LGNANEQLLRSDCDLGGKIVTPDVKRLTNLSEWLTAAAVTGIALGFGVLMIVSGMVIGGY